MKNRTSFNKRIAPEEWRRIKKSASSVADRHIKRSCGGGCGCDGKCTNCQCKAVSDRYLSS